MMRAAPVQVRAAVREVPPTLPYTSVRDREVVVIPEAEEAVHRKQNPSGESTASKF